MFKLNNYNKKNYIKLIDKYKKYLIVRVIIVMFSN